MAGNTGAGSIVEFFTFPEDFVPRFCGEAGANSG
tara:strand:+ start:382 stop:483 length:102 start_codon:yes stop_codon:yes gene_type:complete